MTLEREIYSIESANINKETLEAMKNAKKAMEHIHGGLTIEKVDQTMDELREQHAIGEEIGEAISQGMANNEVDQDELEDELEQLQQEELDNKMLKAGNAPVADAVQKLPTAAQGERESLYRIIAFDDLGTNGSIVKGKATQQEEDEEEELRKLQAEMAM